MSLVRISAIFSAEKCEKARESSKKFVDTKEGNKVIKYFGRVLPFARIFVLLFEDNAKYGCQYPVTVFCKLRIGFLL